MPERRRRPAWLARVERVCGRVGILLVPLALLLWGARDEATQLALSAVAIVTAVVLWAGRALTGRSLRVAWPSVALAGVAGYLGLQLIPMPPGLLSWLSPAAWELYRSAHQPVGLFPAWRPLSLDPPATLYEAARLLGLAGLLVVLDHRARSSDKGRLEVLLPPALTVAALAAVALVLHATGQTSLLGWWSIEGTTTPLVSPIRNENHFAGALGVAMLVLAGVAARSHESPWLRRGAIAAALVCVSTLSISTSTGGAVAAGVGLAVFALLSRTRRTSAWPIVGVMVACVVVLLMALPSSGLGGLRRLEASQGKLAPMGIALSIAGEYPVFGAGRGAFRTLHDRHRIETSAVTFTHVENEPLQAVAELGWPVGLAAVALVLMALAALLRKGRTSVVEAGAAAAAVGLVIHNLVDFSLQYSGAYLLVALLAGATRTKEVPRPVVVWGAGATGLAVVGLAFVVSLPALPVEESRLEALVSTPAVTDAQVEEEARALLSRRPASYVAAQAVIQRAVLSQEPIGKRAAWLGTLLELAPKNGHAHLLAGEALASLGAKGQALLEWRQAAALGVPSVERVLRWYPQFDAVLEASPAEPLQIVEMANRLVAAGRAEWALSLVEVKRTEPQRDLDVLLTDLLAQAGRREEALETARALRREAMDWNFAWRAEALALSRLGRAEESLELLEEGFQRMPGDFMLGGLLAGQRLALDRPEEALETLALIDAKGQAHSRAQLAALRSQAFEQLGKGARAIGEMWTVVSLDPTNTGAMLRLSRLCVAEGRYDEARRALAHAPPEPEVLKLRTLIEQRSQRPRPSGAELETLLR